VDPTSLLAALGPLIEAAQPEWKKEQKALRRRFEDEVRSGLADHHGYVTRWCQERHSVSLATVPVDAPTIDLLFQTVPRRLGIAGQELDELDLLVAPSNLAVLGDLGAGKTTSLRRLAGYVALEPQTRPEDDWKFVVVVVCRDERWDATDLYHVLGKAVGVTGKLFNDLDNPESRIRHVLDVGALIVIDGLDEVPPRLRPTLERDITQLGRHLSTAKIVVSCRSADYVAPLDGFEIAEIRPLSPGQIKELVKQILGDEEAVSFYKALEGNPVAELANRPLFLTYMAAIYKRRGTIPERPTDLYEAITRLVIQEWDEQRGVRRVSKWAEFGIDDKRRFLADLAYQLTRQEVFRFEERTLIDAYEMLAESYELPQQQGRQVAQELESHTGLVVEVGDRHYEFSHAALQEYLAADAMVRAPMAARNGWWTTFPAVAAVTVAMSSDPNRWLCDLIGLMPANLDDIRPLTAFLDRLGQERPRFKRSADLGNDLLRLVLRGHISEPEPVQRLGAIKSVRDSVADALHGYTSVDVGPATTKASRYEARARVPSAALAIPTAVMQSLVGQERLRQVAREVQARHAEH
jgi:hypothetical protein